MKNAEKKSGISKDTITFRLEEVMEPQWDQALKATNAGEGELVRLCIRYGFSKAVKTLMKQRREAENALVRGAGVEPTTATVSMNMSSSFSACAA